MTTIRQKQ